MSRVRKGMVLAIGLLALSWVAHADGTETLGVPVGLDPETGSAIVAAGVGTFRGNGGVIDLSVPLDAEVKQVLAYWAGETTDSSDGDPTITIGGNEVPGALIGGPTFFFQVDGQNANYSAYRADITDLDLVGPGDNMIVVGDMSYDLDNSGVGILAVIDDGTGAADIQLRDGVDLAFAMFPEPRRSMIPQTFVVSEAVVDRVVRLWFFAGSVGEDRPNVIEVTVGSETMVEIDPFSSLDGPLWDTLFLDVEIPAGETMVTVLPISRNDSGSPNLVASLAWITGAIAVPPVCGDGIVDVGEECDDGNDVDGDGCTDCMMDGDGEGCTPGYWKQPHHLDNWTGYDPDDPFDDVFDVTSDQTTLLRAAWARGGGENALARHAVAALLNAANPEVDFGLSTDQVIAIVQEGFSSGEPEPAKEMLELENGDDTECPLGRYRPAPTRRSPLKQRRHQTLEQPNSGTVIQFDR